MAAFALRAGNRPLGGMLPWGNIRHNPTVFTAARDNRGFHVCPHFPARNRDLDARACGRGTAICSRRGVSVGNVNLITAALDLQLVRLLRGAIAANATQGALAGPGALHPRRRIQPEPVIEPRKRIEPEPRFEPRKRIEPEPRIEPRPVDRPAEPEMPVRTRSPIEPPWAVRAWENPIEPTPKIKIITYRPDVIHKGSLIDLFI